MEMYQIYLAVKFPTELYCQSPKCKNPLLSKDDSITNLLGHLVHTECIGDSCLEAYVTTDPLKWSVDPVPYNKARWLAKLGLVRYTKLDRQAFQQEVEAAISAHSGQ